MYVRGYMFYLQVERDSSVWFPSGLIVAIIIVLQLPPRLSLGYGELCVCVCVSVFESVWVRECVGKRVCERERERESV